MDILNREDLKDGQRVVMLMWYEDKEFCTVDLKEDSLLTELAYTEHPQKGTISTGRTTIETDDEFHVHYQLDDVFSLHGFYIFSADLSEFEIKRYEKEIKRIGEEYSDKWGRKW